MDKQKMAADFLEKLQMLRKLRPQKYIDNSLHGEAFVLAYIALNSEGVLPGDISQQMDVSSARIAKALNGLENKGYITRQINTQDRRQIVVKATQTGKELAEEHRKAVLEEVVKLFDLLGDHDANEYIRITGKLVALAKDYKWNCEKSQ